MRRVFMLHGFYSPYRILLLLVYRFRSSNNYSQGPVFQATELHLEEEGEDGTCAYPGAFELVRG